VFIGLGGVAVGMRNPNLLFFVWTTLVMTIKVRPGYVPQLLLASLLTDIVETEHVGKGVTI